MTEGEYDHIVSNNVLHSMSIMPTLRHLKIFTEVAKQGKMSEASLTLYLSQSTISQAISELEGYYNIILFERLCKKLVITDIGRELLKDATDILTKFENMEDHIKELRHSYIFRIGSSAAATQFIDLLVQELSTRIPDIIIKVFSFSASFAESRLLDNGLDVAILGNKLESGDIITIPFFQDEFCFICGREHPFYGRDVIDPQELKNQLFVLQSESSGTRQVLENYMRNNHMEIKSNWYCNNPSLVKEWVAKNRGISLLSKYMVRNECLSGELHGFRLNGITLDQPLYVAYHKDKYKSKAMSAFIDICKNMSLYIDTF